MYRLDVHLYERRGGHLVVTTPQAGDYWQNLDNGWMLQSPGGVIKLTEYEIKVENDGTLTVKGLIKAKEGYPWKGYLVKGEWSFG